MTDEELVIAARDGDSVAFSELVERHQRRLIHLALKYRLTPQDAEDAVQQTMLKAWQHLDTFRQESRFSTWLTRVLINEVFQSHRKRSRMRLEEMDDPADLTAALEGGRSLTQPAVSQEQQLLVKEQHKLLRRALGSLPESLRAVLLMQVFQEQSLEQIAARLQRPVATVKSRRHRAQLELRKRFSQRLRPMDGSLAYP